MFSAKALTCVTKKAATPRSPSRYEVGYSFRFSDLRKKLGTNTRSTGEMVLTGPDVHQDLHRLDRRFFAAGDTSDSLLRRSSVSSSSWLNAVEADSADTLWIQVSSYSGMVESAVLVGDGEGSTESFSGASW
jgi:hypothetical protein